MGVPKRQKIEDASWDFLIVKRSALKRRFQKYATLINRTVRSRIMAQKPKLKKTGFDF